MPGPTANPLGGIDYGKDYNFYNKLVVSAGAFATDCDIVIRFPTETVTFQLEVGASVEYSFNGTTTHGDMTSGLSSASLTFINRPICKIWFKGTGTVRIEAWGIR